MYAKILTMFRIWLSEIILFKVFELSELKIIVVILDNNDRENIIIIILLLLLPISTRLLLSHLTALKKMLLKEFFCTENALLCT